jgi:hypothetical protein
MAVTALESVVVQRFKKSSYTSTTAVTLVPSTVHESEARPNHLAATQVVFTYTSTPENLWGVLAANAGLADDQEYEITVRRIG